MNHIDKINRFRRFGLTNNVGLYNEDSTTAQALNIQCNKKMIECLNEIEKQWADIELIKKALNLNYSEGSEELELTITESLEAIKVQVDSSYRAIVDENSMTSIEQAGCQAAAINECLKAINMMREVIDKVKTTIGLTYDGSMEELTITGGVE